MASTVKNVIFKMRIPQVCMLYIWHVLEGNKVSKTAYLFDALNFCIKYTDVGF